MVILPAVERIPLETLRTLETYVQSGGALVATRRTPALAPGYRASAADHDAVRALAQSLFSASGRAVLVAREDAQLSDKLASLRAPDVSLADFRSDIGFIHRHWDDGEAYFLANTSNIRRETAATFRVSALDAEWWDPVSGEMSAGVPTASSARSTTLRLVLEPYASKILVFSKRRPTPRASTRASASIPALDLSGDWTVRFRPGDPTVTMHTLRSWTDDPSTRGFSGVATYSKDVTVPDGMLRPGVLVRLDVGEARAVAPQPMRNGMRAWLDPPVREAAVVYVNDHRAGAIWCPPYSLDVTSYLQRGVNRLRFDVGNLAVNYMAAHPLPDYRLLNLRYGVRFEAQDMQLIMPEDAGLLAPVRLVATPR
jgi:hypothetical protein